MSARVSAVLRGSIAEKNGIKPGDVIVSINGKKINDYLDYMFSSANELLEIELNNRNITLENVDFEPLGIEFDSLLIDEPRSCHNKCVFCFIDQLPDNMRESCYFKDDDYRLSFLQGNYVTLTNMSDSDLDRIIEYAIPRINVSVHTTNPELRVKMLNNKFAGKIMEQIKRFADGGLRINCQVVLCRGYNDEEELDRTISDLACFGDCIESLSIVPVGISAHRYGLTQLVPFDQDSSKRVIEQVEKWQKKFQEEFGMNFVYLADEFYIMAGADIPSAKSYDGFPQIENGVGLCASLKAEFEDALCSKRRKKVKTPKTVVTGHLVYGFIKNLVSELEKSEKINVVKITNRFFGENITVSGLVTGKDIINQLKDKNLGKSILIPASMLKHEEPIFLDDTSISEVEEELKTKVVVVNNDGYDFLEKLIK